MGDAERVLVIQAIEEYYCRDRKTIAAVIEIKTGESWSLRRVDYVLHTIRSDSTLDVWIPHVERGGSDHLYQVLRKDLVDGGIDESDNGVHHLLSGAVSTYRTIASMGENEGRVLDAAAEHVNPVLADEFRRVATIARGQAAMSPTRELRTMLEELAGRVGIPL